MCQKVSENVFQHHEKDRFPFHLCKNVLKNVFPYYYRIGVFSKEMHIYLGSQMTIPGLWVVKKFW